ncbi:PIN domain-containing protein [Aromatoleum diolicum]|uniref:PIN domain-containing protein n=1 Tax=Aromatoleum diolicum TaxID=75796 RepID=A0ABX1QE98_9RHOO|nr:PIN domain-containing protein [Aromatoleum diolicum]NMG75822.1 PIN domain-containing protein [Aromatoleum diolicum]
MTDQPALPALRLVLDTNTVMALWFFEDPALQPLRHLIEDTPPTLIARGDSLEELRRVLAYRQFGIAAERQAALLAEYAARTTVIAADADNGVSIAAPLSAPRPAALPVCRDPDDQKFLEIARDGSATHLVSRDKALLRLNRHRLVRPLFAILTPEALVAMLPMPSPAQAPVR